MTRRAPAEVYQALLGAGFSPSDALTMTAIAGAETGGSWDDADTGDVSLETSLWGPSYGVFQIRTQKPATGSGADRDIAALAGNLARQAAAAFHISNSGRDFSPWTVYNTGAFQRYLSQAQGAASSAVPGGIAATPAGLLPSASDVLGGVRSLALTAAFVVAGLGLVALGLWRAGAGGKLRGELGRELGNAKQFAGVLK